MHSRLMKTIVSIEYLFATVLTALFFVVIGEFQWYWLIVLFLVFDISAIGYVINNRIGAFTYNLGHSLIGPVVAMGYFAMTSNELALFISLLWLFHIFVDRTLGFGLKHTTSFHHTHLGTISKAKK